MLRIKHPLKESQRLRDHTHTLNVANTYVVTWCNLRSTYVRKKVPTDPVLEVIESLKMENVQVFLQPYALLMPVLLLFSEFVYIQSTLPGNTLIGKVITRSCKTFLH